MNVEETIAANLHLSDAELVALLNGPTIEIANTIRWHSDGIAREIGPVVFGQLDEVLKAAPGLGWVRIALASERGLDFSQPEMQAGIEALRATIGNSLTDQLKALGITRLDPWSNDGRSGIATIEFVAATRQALNVNAAREVLRQYVTAERDRLLILINGGELTTTDAINAAAFTGGE